MMNEEEKQGEVTRVYAMTIPCSSVEIEERGVIKGTSDGGRGDTTANDDTRQEDEGLLEVTRSSIQERGAILCLTKKGLAGAPVATQQRGKGGDSA